MVITTLLELGCGKTPFDRKYHKVTQILNGNTIEVYPKIKVHLIGINNTKESEVFLSEYVLRHRVRIKFDKSKRYRKVKAGAMLYGYVITDKRVSVNGQILMRKFSALDTYLLNDSLSQFQHYVDGSFNFRKTNKTENSSRRKSVTGRIRKWDFLKKSRKNRKKKTLEEIIEKVKPAVFLIITTDGNNNPIAQGTGFFIDRSGIGVSNHHVFEDGTKAYVKILNSPEYHKVTKIYIDNDEHDYIVFQVESEGNQFKYFNLSSEKPQQGESVFVLGNPKGLESTLTTGIISSIRSEISTNDYIQIDAAVSHGSSGSPLCNMDGQVVGVVVSKIEGCENCNFAINMEIIKKDLIQMR